MSSTPPVIVTDTTLHQEARMYLGDPHTGIGPIDVPPIGNEPDRAGRNPPGLHRKHRARRRWRCGHLEGLGHLGSTGRARTAGMRSRVSRHPGCQDGSTPPRERTGRRRAPKRSAPCPGSTTSLVSNVTTTGALPRPRRPGWVRNMRRRTSVRLVSRVMFYSRSNRSVTILRSSRVKVTWSGLSW